jgi:hypothetical protein
VDAELALRVANRETIVFAAPLGLGAVFVPAATLRLPRRRRTLPRRQAHISALRDDLAHLRPAHAVAEARNKPEDFSSRRG